MRVLLFFLSVAIAECATITGKVVGVHDGDTLTLLVESSGKKESVRVRLWGIDAPESKQPFGQRGKEELSKLVFGKTIEVEVKDKDRYGRTVGRVTVPPATDVNLQMVTMGFAWWYRDFAKTGPEAKALEGAQANAKAAKRGLWSEPSPTPPWEWRRAQTSKASK